MDVDITAPLVYFPERSTSKTCIAADLGRLIVTNTFDKAVDEMSNGFMGTDRIKATLKDVEIFV